MADPKPTALERARALIRGSWHKLVADPVLVQELPALIQELVVQLDAALAASDAAAPGAGRVTAVGHFPELDVLTDGQPVAIVLFETIADARAAGTPLYQRVRLVPAAEVSRG